MLKRTCLILVLLIFLIGSVLGAEIEEEVFEEVVEGEVSVIVVLEENSGSIKERQEEVLDKLNLEEKKGFLGFFGEEKEFEVSHKYSTVNAFSGEVTKKGLAKLENDPKVKKIFFNKVLQVVLDSSIPQINADDVQEMSMDGVNIAGSGETVCMIDTGIDTDHTAFTGRILDEYCYCSVSGSPGCCPDGNAVDDSAEDDHGHGTHVTGIAAGNHDTYKGVAPEAGIIAIKVCDNTGNCNSDDVISAIDWCTSNASIYNISAISISLGGDGPYNDYCDNNSYGIAPGINSAAAENISVVIASGNSGWTNGISSPACVENATPVGAVNSGDGIMYNRGDVLDLLAPGESITAPYKGGGTATLQGTSMSTPHVAGAIALLHQFNRLQMNQALTPQGVENIFNLTGELVEDSGSGKNYSRIDVLNAVLSVDNVAPTINFVSPTPENGTSQNLAVINITASETLQNATLEWDGINETMDGSGISFYKIKDDLSDGEHTFRVYGTDFTDKTDATESRSFTFDSNLNITFNFPLDNSYHNSAFNLDIIITDHNSISMSSYNITNSSGDLVQGNSNDSIGLTSFAWTDLVDVPAFFRDNYTLTVFADDSAGNFDVKSVNFIVQNMVPLVNITEPADGVVVEAGDFLQFNVTASDPDDDSLTYNWDFNDSTSSSEQNPLKQFNSTGEFIVSLTVSDGYDVNLSSIVVAVNDTQPPEEQSVSFDDGMYVGVNQNVSAVFFDYSGIFNVSLYSEGVKEGTCSENGVVWSCSWSWEIDSYGDYSFILEAVDDLSFNAQNYSHDFSVLGCGDEAKNGNEECDNGALGGETCVSQGYDLGDLTCSSSCTLDNSSCSFDSSGDDTSGDEGGDTGGSGGSGGGGGGGGGSTTTTAAEEVLEIVEEPIEEEVEKSVEEAPKEQVEESLSLASADSEVMAAGEVTGEEAEETKGGISLLTGWAVGFIKGMGGWTSKEKVLLSLGILIIILLAVYFIFRRKG